MAAFTNKPGYGSERTLIRYAQALSGFQRGASLEEISKVTGLSEKIIAELNTWWKSEFAAEKPEEKTESVPVEKEDLLILEARRKHFDELATLMKTWRDELNDTITTGAFEEHGQSEQSPLLPYLLQHCSSVSERYEAVKLSRAKYKTAVEEKAR